MDPVALLAAVVPIATLGGSFIYAWGSLNAKIAALAKTVDAALPRSEYNSSLAFISESLGEIKAELRQMREDRK